MSSSIYNLTELRRAISETAGKYGVTMPQLVGPNQNRTCVRARRAVARMLAAPPYCMPTSEIAGHLGERHHSTILNLLRKDDPELRRSATLSLPAEYPFRQSIAGDLQERLEQIARTRQELAHRLRELDELEGALRDTLTRVEKVA